MMFRSPWVLFFMPAILFWAAIFLWRRIHPAVFFSSVDLVKPLPGSWRTRLLRIPLVLRLLTIALFLLALAGPRSLQEDISHKGEGINIVLVMDVSTSMAAEDFTLNGRRTNRLDVIKSVVRDFINARTNDRLGLVAFAARPYVVSPLTADHDWLNKNLDRLKFGLIEDGTAIGTAIISAINRLKDVDGRSKVVILLTDGANNAGTVDCATAARAAEAKGIKVYTIGAGSRGLAPYPVSDIFGRTVYQQVNVDIDEEILRVIAGITGGAYFRATDTDSLKDVYAQIDRMEKVAFDDNRYRLYDEHFDFVLLIALAILLLESVLSRTIFLRIP